MLPLILGGLAAYTLLKRNPLRPGKRGAAARRRALARVVRAARINKRSRGARHAVYRSMLAQVRAAKLGLRRRRISAAVERGIARGRRRNPKGLSAALCKRLMEWRSPDYPAIKALATSKHPATEAYDALRQLMQQYERADLRKGDLAHLAKTIRMVERETGVSAPRDNPKRRRGVTPSGAAARLAQWRWHRNPVWGIKPGDRVTIRTPHGQERTGRVVMRGSDGWVLNLGGRSGTPGIATPDNIVRVTRGKRRGATILG